ncbi:MAG TPA: GNAT family N-acetyltransferase [Gemmatimonadales bacterium]|nr:GNAT family N-acetyltransferase [Gemmatimonadales bacterium]
MANVVMYRDEWRGEFERLNREWIETWFVLEEADRETFRDPAAKIIAPGGQIFFVVEDGKVLGTCAVIRHRPDVHEIAKMAVAPEARGKGYGDLLMDAAVEFSRGAGASRVVIVSNTRLAPAIRLYEKHGFVRVPLDPNEQYARADIRLERNLTATAKRAEAPVRPPG